MVKTKTVVRLGEHELAISHPDKPIWPEAGITKLKYVQLLAELAPFLLPYAEGRYLTTIRYPEGIHGVSFYQKNCPEPIPEYVRTAKDGSINYVVLDSVKTLLWMGSLYSLEFHVSSDEIDNPLPNTWMLDIDPSLSVEPYLMEATEHVLQALDSLGLSAVAKTSGATGVQIVMPIERGPDFDELRRFGKFLSEYLVARHPRLFTVERLKKDRGPLIYLDYLQHYAGKTLPAPYSPRARPMATVSTPLTRAEVRKDVKPTDFHLLNVPQRLRERGDPLAAVPRQSLGPVIAHLLGKK
ncbi:DNA polymerase domain-containing protein [Cohnella sp. CIP 111063]|uniref:non-homologous end-joining DNA ligase n=1 Tax=unclassified Cohnella TaxID=2636738 RepID=UPI000B8C6053|nr:MULTISPECIES: non-homologous end-joining DNA ligase [unclassified Cohnella]OXS61614.1 DNA polymerase domain-containing protein [Cohnella sp. CIP 111063]PRX74031.1 bifunctional non-homologous end joining protein LigD [Cohnella sp. SGD-V74]